MCSESLGSEKVSYGPCADQESCESLAAMAKFLVIRFDCSIDLFQYFLNFFGWDELNIGQIQRELSKSWAF